MTLSTKRLMTCQSAVAVVLALAVAACSSAPAEDPAVTAAREARAAEQRAAKAAAEARAAEEQRQAIRAHNTQMEGKIASYQIGKTSWKQVQSDFGLTYRDNLLNPTAGKVVMLSTVRTATQRFDDPSKSTPLVGRIVIGTWKGTRRKGQVLVNYDRHPEHFNVLVTLDFVNNMLVEKY